MLFLAANNEALTFDVLLVLSGFAPESKVVYCDYGFDLERLKGRRRLANEPFTFAYIGTHKAHTTCPFSTSNAPTQVLNVNYDKEDLHTYTNRSV